MGRRSRELWIGVLGVVIGLAANAIAAGAALSLLGVPDGARVRPIGEGLALFFGAMVGLCGSVVASGEVRKVETRWLGIAGLLLGLTPFPVGLTLIRCVLGLKHLVLLP